MDRGFTVQDKAIVVTGGARGIGLAQARLLAQHGAKVVIVDNGSALSGRGVQSSAAQEAADAIAEAGGITKGCSADLSTLAGCEEAIATCIEAYGTIDGLCHYASPCPDLKGPEAIEDQDVELLLAVNPVAAMRLARAAWPKMRAQGFGRVVLAPSAALYGAAGNTPYAAAKAALIGVVRCLAVEGAAVGIRVNGVLPAAQTRMTEGFLHEPYATWFFERMAPERVAAGAAWLLSEDCDLTGEILALGGGRIARMRLAEGEGAFAADDTADAVETAIRSAMGEVHANFPGDLAERSAKVAALFGPPS
ncbi:SDR family NAD(P)-dependent oxidoreductase [Novosphingobium sp. M1R2S20]|uniref:SDR family NAD(P)-dependent oxidoreductase n=1 Tax=Novosphingobium rhizovicinum TaxID=3228928 RepID=A0ABV3R891_9SPHN